MSSLVRISEAASLALHTAALLARAPDRRFTNQEIAGLLGASGHHLAKVMQRLVKAGLIDSARGPQGGFRLERPADEVSLLDVYEAVDGPVSDGGCLLGEPACQGGECLLAGVIGKVQQEVRDYLAATTLEQLGRSMGLISLDDQEVAK